MNLIIEDKKNIKNFLEWKKIIKLYIILFFIYLKKYIILLFKWNFSWLKNIEKIKEFYIEKEKFLTKNRKKWISWFARLKNGDDFLQKSIESIINFLDEIILVDNQSTDKTKEICLKLQKKYPDKIKFYEYNFEVYWVWNKKYDITPENSIHSLSYYYNWCLSKTNYQYAIKIDDDNFFIKDEIKKIISKINKNKFYIIPWINIIKKNNNYYIPEKYPFAWLYWDYWFFKVSPKTYFIKDKNCENFLHPYFFKIEKISFFHLKYLKKDFWFINYWEKIKKIYIKKITNNLIKVDNLKLKKYIKNLKNII